MSSRRPPTSAYHSVDLIPPPRERVPEKVRRWWRSRGRHRGLRYWLVLRGAPILVGFSVLYVANGIILGWRTAYEVCIGIVSPAATGVPVLAWFLSIIGWLLVPGLAGAVAGYVVTTMTTERRTKPIERLFSTDEE